MIKLWRSITPPVLHTCDWSGVELELKGTPPRTHNFTSALRMKIQHANDVVAAGIRLKYPNKEENENPKDLRLFSPMEDQCSL